MVLAVDLVDWEFSSVVFIYISIATRIAQQVRDTGYFNMNTGKQPKLNTGYFNMNSKNFLKDQKVQASIVLNLMQCIAYAKETDFTWNQVWSTFIQN